jgi:hypothetical protein
VPALVVEELPSARAQERKDVLEIGRRARCSAKGRRVEWAASRSEEENARKAASDLEAPRVEVPVRNAIPGEVEKRPQQDGRESRAAGGAGRSARRYVEGDDHVPSLPEQRGAAR